MSEKISDFDPTDLLDGDDAIEMFLNEALSTGDARHIASALGVAARSKGMSSVARETGLAREQLYRSLSENGNPTLETLLAVMKAIGFRFESRRAA